MLNSLRAACEAMNFQTASPLGKELTELFQRAFDYRDNLDYSKVDPKGKDEYRNRQMHLYCKDKLFPAMCVCFEKHTNVRVLKVTNSGQYGISGLFAVDLSMDNVFDMLSVMGQYSGNDTVPNNIPDTLAELMSMSELFDPNTPKLKSNTFGKGKRVQVSMWFDAAMAFLPMDYLPNHLIDPVTPAELAAIMMHETGHVVTLVEHAGDTYARINRLTEHLQQLAKNQDPKKTIEQLITSGKPILTELAKSGTITKEYAETIERALDGAGYMSEQSEESLLHTGAVILYQMLEVLGGLFMKIFPVVIAARVIVNTIVVAQKECMIDLKEKSSDTIRTQHNLYLVERLADEYVNRHGMGAYLASGLRKLFATFAMITTPGALATGYSSRLRKSRTYNLLVKVTMFLYETFGGSGMLAHPAYEEPLARLERIAQNTLAVFKNDLPKTVAAHYIADYEAIMSEIARAKKQDPNFIRKIINFLVKFGNPAMLVSMIATGRLSADYELALNQMESLINNRLYYLGTKFGNLHK